MGFMQELSKECVNGFAFLLSLLDTPICDQETMPNILSHVFRLLFS